MSQAAAPFVRIQPPDRAIRIGWAELWRARELLYFMAKRELQIRYKQSIFGVTWAVLQPLLYAFVFALFFGSLANVPSEGVPYTVFALAAVVPWLFTSQGTSQAAASLVADANLLGKVYFPRLVIPVAKILSFLVDLVVALAVLGVFVAAYGESPTAGLALMPLFLLLAFATVCGAGLLLSTLNVKYRDVAVAIPLLVQLWLFATPVVYPGSLITGAWQYVYALNPLVTVIEGTRWAFLGTDAPALAVTAISTASALALLAAALVYFRRTERYLADII
jgi:lipopolysaccharide transport system permease protein